VQWLSGECIFFFLKVISFAGNFSNNGNFKKTAFLFVILHSFKHTKMLFSDSAHQITYKKKFVNKEIFL
jgi:hypothetical protein